MDRYWLITSTTYGNWLPGDARGFVAPVRDASGRQTIHNVPGTEYDRDLPGMKAFSAEAMRGPPVVFNRAQAEALLIQFHETARHRGWELRAVGILATHVHIVVGVPGDPEPEDILRDFKSYGSRRLNRGWGRPESGTWWTESGSTRKLPNEAAVLAAIEYVRNQSNPLVIWIAGEDPLPEFPTTMPAGKRRVSEGERGA